MIAIERINNCSDAMRNFPICSYIAETYVVSGNDVWVIDKGNSNR